MSTAREIITGALSFGLNRLSPGETLDADTGAMCLDALNHLADEFNGRGSFLFREILTAGTVTSVTGTISSTWNLIPGVQILGAYYTDSGQDTDIAPITLAQYACITDKDQPGDPEVYAFDGYDTVRFYPVPTSLSVTLRTKAYFANFADLDTDYGMPAGYKAAFSDMLAEKVGPSLVGELSPRTVRNAANARKRLTAQAANPAIISGGHRVPSILTGW